MKITWLIGVNSLDELRKEYYRLAKVHHPDIGGDVVIMQVINNEYEYLREMLLKNPEFQTWEREREEKTMEAYADIINQIIDIPDVVIEIIGTWVWVSGMTFVHRYRLKESGFKFSHNKEAWFWHSGGYRKLNKKKYDLDDIRYMFGSETVQGKEEEKRKHSEIDK